jgi:hypothetical protein
MLYWLEEEELPNHERARAYSLFWSLLIETLLLRVLVQT